MAIKGIISFAQANSSYKEFKKTAPRRGSKGISHSFSPKSLVKLPSASIAFKVYSCSRERTRDYSGGGVKKGKSAIL